MHNFFNDYVEAFERDDVASNITEESINYIPYYFEHSVQRNAFYDVGGIDHAGHGFKTVSPEFDEAVEMDDDLMRLAINSLEDDDVLMIFSDHGLIDTDIYAHGFSQEEV